MVSPNRSNSASWIDLAMASSDMSLSPRVWLNGLAGSEIDDRRHAAVRCAFVDLELLLPDLDVVEVAKRVLDHGAGVEILDQFRSAGAVLELLGCVSLNDDEPAA